MAFNPNKHIVGALVLSLWLVSCAQAPVVEEPVTGTVVADVSLVQTDIPPGESEQFNIGVLIFDTDLIGAQSTQLNEWLIDAIAEKEVHYLPFVLRNTLVRSNQWGSIRVLPESDPSLDLEINGSILSSDGNRLVLEITATDSTGRQWLNEIYTDTTSNEDYLYFNTTRPDYSTSESGEMEPVDPFQDLFDQVANDLLAVRESLNSGQLSDIALVSQMRYAQDLSPETFAGILQTGPDGLLTVTRLLAENDPMMRRVADIKLRHYLYIDTVDEYYQALYDEMQPLYDLWRQYSREQIIELRERPGNNSDVGTGLRAMTQTYNRFKWAKIYEQEFASLTLGFNNEVAPAILELNRQVRGLSGDVEEQYAQWRDILRQLFEVETGQSVSGN